MRGPQILTLVIAAVFLGACNLMPPLVETNQIEQSVQTGIATPVSYTRAKSNALESATKKMVTFPNMVKTTEFSEPETAEVSEIEALLKAEGIDIENLDALEAGGFSTQSFNSRRLFFAQFTTRVPRRIRSYQVKIPTSGQFELKLKEGSRYKVLDNDATDGQAVIQMPASTLKTWMHLNRNWRSDSELKVEDPLYYLSDTLSSARKQWFSRTRWLSMGLRPLPVPSEWKSPQGNDFVLNMTAKNVSSFSMIWLQQKNKQASYPPGIKEIGPEGGIVELPGIITLQIPENALDSKQIIRIEQMKEVQEYPDYDPIEGPDAIDIVPPVRFFPENLKLSKPGSIRAALTPERVRFGNDEQFHATGISYESFLEGIPPDKGFLLDLDERNTDGRMNYNEWYKLPELTIVRVLGYPRRTFKTSSFSTQQVSFFEEPTPHMCFGISGANMPPYAIFEYSRDTSLERKKAICQGISDSYVEYKKISTEFLPVAWENTEYENREYNVIPIYLKKLEGSATTSARWNSKESIFNLPESNIDSSGNIDNLLDTSAHENYHIFQVANMKRTGPLSYFTISPWLKAYDNPSRSWLPESVSRFMGAYVGSKYASKWISKFETNARTPEGFLYNQAPYGRSLAVGVKNFADRNHSFLDTPLGNDGIDPQYSRVNIPALMNNTIYQNSKGKVNGIKRLHDADINYLIKGEYGIISALKSVNSIFSIERAFPTWASMIALKEYGLGTEKKENFTFKKIAEVEKLDAVDYKKPLTPDLRTTRDNPYNIAGTQSFNEIKNMQAQYFYLEYKNLSKSQVVYVYLEPDTIESSVTQILTNENAENYLGKGIRVMLLKEKTQQKDFLPYKPELADIKSGKKIRKAIHSMSQSKNKVNIEGKSKSVYYTAFPLPVNDDVVRMLVSVTLPYFGEGNRVRVRYQLKTFIGGPELISFEVNDEGKEKQRVVEAIVKDCEPDDCIFSFDSRDDQEEKILVNAELLENLGEDDNGRKIQKWAALIPNSSKVNGELTVLSDNWPSNAVEEKVVACNMLPENVSLSDEFNVKSANTLQKLVASCKG